MGKEFSFTRKTIIIAGVIALILAAAIGWGCFTAGDNRGYDSGYEIGYAEGQDEGYTNGYDEGYDLGYSDAESEFTAYPTGDYYVATADDPLTIREEPAQNAKKLGTVPRGADINVTDVTSHWGYVTFEEIGGWINLDYCAVGKNPNPPAEYTSMTVYVTDTGECYHKDGCSYLKSRNPISLEEAQKRYRPCSRCW